MSDVCTAYSVPGPRGNPGAAGADGVDGINAFTQTTAAFTVPAVAATVAIAVDDSSWAVATQAVYIEAAGYYEVAAVPDGTHITVENLGATGNAVAGTIIPPAVHVGPAGIPGATGAAGAAGANGTNGTNGTNGVNGTNGTNGVNAFTTLTSNFTMPAASASATANVGDTSWMVIGQPVFMEGAGTLEVAAIGGATTVDLENLGYSGNAAPATVIGAGAKIAPSGFDASAGGGDVWQGTQIALANINGAASSENHGLAGVPQLYGYELVCTTADAPFAVGDVVDLRTCEIIGPLYAQLDVWADANEVGINRSAQAATAIRPGGGGIVAASWRLRPYAIYFA